MYSLLTIISPFIGLLLLLNDARIHNRDSIGFWCLILIGLYYGYMFPILVNIRVIYELIGCLFKIYQL